MVPSGSERETICKRRNNCLSLHITTLVYHDSIQPGGLRKHLQKKVIFEFLQNNLDTPFPLGLDIFDTFLGA